MITYAKGKLFVVLAAETKFYSATENIVIVHCFAAETEFCSATKRTKHLLMMQKQNCKDTKIIPILRIINLLDC
jgi:hypothetical protein